MAVSFVAAGLGSGSSSSSVPGLPAGIQNDDILLLVCEAAATEPIPATPSGWSLVDQVYETGDVATGTRLSVFWRRVVGGESGPTLPVDPAEDHIVSRIAAYRGCRTVGNPWNAVTGGVDSSAGTSVSITGVTTTVANCMILNIICTPFDTNVSNQVDGWTNGNLTGITERMDNFTTASNGGGIGLVEGTKATAGATGATTVTLTNSAVAAFMTIALDPTVTPPGGTASTTSTANTPSSAIKVSAEVVG